jgi:hypothetical protein
MVWEIGNLDLLCQIRAGRAIAPPTVASLPTRRALQGSEIL